MSTIYAATFALLAFPFLFPEEFIRWIRQVRHRVEEDLRRRLTPEQWEAYRADVPDF